MFVLLVATAAATDEDSLRASASFGLFRDAYDYLQEPGSLGRQPGRDLYTLLGNQGGTGRFSLGYVGAVGPGVLGAIGDVGIESSHEHGSTSRAATAASDATREETAARSDTRSFSATLGYGVPLGERWSVGAGFEVASDSWSTTLAPDPPNDPIVGGTLTDGGGAEESGSWEQRALTMGGTLGAVVAAGPLDLDLAARLARVQDAAHGRSERHTADEDYVWSGYDAAGSLAGNVTGWVPGAGLDARVAVGPAAVRLQVEGDHGVLAPSRTRHSESYTGPDTSWSEDETLSAARADWSAGSALAVLELRSGATEVRVGVGVDAAREQAEYTTDTVRYADGAASSATTRHRIVTQEVDLALPLAVESAVSKTVAVRAGAEWLTWVLDTSSRDVLRSDPGEGDTTADSSHSTTWRSVVQLAVGARWDVAPIFSLDVVASGTGLPDERVGLDLGNLLVSGVFHL